MINFDILRHIGTKMNVNFRGNFPMGLTRKQIRDVSYLVADVGIYEDIPHTVCNQRLLFEPFTLEEGVLKYAFRLSSVNVLISWHYIKPGVRIALCTRHVRE